MNDSNIIQNTRVFVKQQLEGAESGHDWFHIERVYKNALLILKQETADILVVKLAALLHDIADSKFHDGNETIGPKRAEAFLNTLNIDPKTVSKVIHIIKYMSFKNSFDEHNFKPSKAFQIVQDADRLDAIGAIGIARCFNYGGFKNRAIYDPAIPPNNHLNKVSYTTSTAPSINHFYEKLLLIKDHLHTPTAKAIAEERHAFMEAYLEQFYKEWNGKA